MEEKKQDPTGIDQAQRLKREFEEHVKALEVNRVSLGQITDGIHAKFTMMDNIMLALPQYSKENTELYKNKVMSQMDSFGALLKKIDGVFEKRDLMFEKTDISPEAIEKRELLCAPLPLLVEQLKSAVKVLEEYIGDDKAKIADITETVSADEGVKGNNAKRIKDLCEKIEEVINKMVVLEKTLQAQGIIVNLVEPTPAPIPVSKQSSSSLFPKIFQRMFFGESGKMKKGTPEELVPLVSNVEEQKSSRKSPITLVK